MNDDLVYRLRKRAEIRRQIPSRKSVQEGSPDRIADLLEEAADALRFYEDIVTTLRQEGKTEMTDRELMQMALDWLPKELNISDHEPLKQLKQDLRDRLAQPDPLKEMK
jgi:hypothetical protein